MSQQQHQGRLTPQFKVGDKVVSTDAMGTWEAEVVSMRRRTGSAATRRNPDDDGWAYETLGRFTSGWAVEECKSVNTDEPTLRQLWNVDLTLRDDRVAQVQQVADDLVAQEGCDEARAADLQQCMDDLMAQEGLL